MGVREELPERPVRSLHKIYLFYPFFFVRLYYFIPLTLSSIYSPFALVAPHLVTAFIARLALMTEVASCFC